MKVRLPRYLFLGLLIATPVCGQTADDPFPVRIDATAAATVDFVEFARLPDIEDGDPARPTIMFDEPGTGRLFVNDMTGPIYSVSHDGSNVVEYVDINDSRWGVGVQSRGRERGLQSIAFHPQFGVSGAPGYGRFYTWTDVVDTGPTPDFTPGDGQDSHDTVLLEWTARDASAGRYDGGAPRELLRLEQPFANHNAGQLGFNPVAESGDADFGMLYVGVADGGSGGDPLNLSQNMRSPFGKILRIDPLGSNSSNGEYGIPSDNPFVGRGGSVLPEIYASGVRNPQRFDWDPATGNLFLADIGQNLVEELSIVTSGANLGWNTWEGSFRFLSRSELDISDPRSDPAMTYPVAEYSQQDPLFEGNCCAVTGVKVYRGGAISALDGTVVFGDNPSGELFYIDADDLPDGGPEGIHRILLNDGGTARTLLQVIQSTNESQDRRPARRVDLRLGSGPNGEVILLNKQDGVVRMLVP